MGPGKLSRLGLNRIPYLINHCMSSVEGPEKSRDVSPPPDPLQQRYFSGVVTSITSDSGMINDYVYFEMGVVLGGVKAEVGDVVHVQAERKHTKGGWRAIR